MLKDKMAEIFKMVAREVFWISKAYQPKLLKLWDVIAQ
jgi:hypothetical protein